MLSHTKTPPYFINTTTGTPSLPTMHYHNTYDIYYIESGTRNYFVEDFFFVASPDDFVLIKSSALHQIGEGEVIRTLVSFTEEYLKTMFSPDVVHRLLKCFDKPLVSPTTEQLSVLKPLLSSLAESKDPISFAIHLGSFLLRLSTCTPDSSYNTRISSILKFLNQNYSHIQTIEQIADYLHVSKQYLCKIFKDSMGITIIDYLNKIKIKNACVLLETSKKNLTEICHLCGFHSSAYFSFVFKNNMGISPLQYRQKHKKL